MPAVYGLPSVMLAPVSVLPNLYQLAIPTPFPVGPVNVYVARDLQGDGVTLVDCGPRTPEARGALDAGLAALGHSVHSVCRIVVTHTHADHYGLAASLVNESGARVLAHPFSRPMLEAYAEERERRLAFYADLLRISGVPDELGQIVQQARRSIGDYAEAVPVSGALNDGDTLTMAGCEWQVIHTPGHSAGLVCLYEPLSCVLLSNDHLLRDISSNPVVEPPLSEHARRIRSLVEYLGQLRRVAAMSISVAWPGHGDLIYDVPELVRQRIEFHTRRARRILELLDGQALTTYQIVRPLFPSLDSINFFLAISEVLGHLELLESEHRAHSTQHNGVIVWQKTTTSSG